MGKTSSRSSSELEKIKRKISSRKSKKNVRNFDAPLEDQGVSKHFEGVDSLFIPYKGKKPAALSINGHRIIILSQDAAAFEENLALVGADRLRHIDGKNGASHTQWVVGKIAARVKAGIVMAPHEVGLPDLVASLKLQLPWIQ